MSLCIDAAGSFAKQDQQSGAQFPGIKRVRAQLMLISRTDRALRGGENRIAPCTQAVSD
jgi:hypothetical protein